MKLILIGILLIIICTLNLVVQHLNMNAQTTVQANFIQVKERTVQNIDKTESITRVWP